MSSYGKIKVEMYTATEALPVTNGYAVINRIVDGVEVFNQTVYTDDNGQCPEISVETPDEWLSFDPFAIEAPYYEYNIYAYAEGFSNVTIENMQVYPNVLSLQTIEMIPRVQTPQNSSGYNFTEEDIIYSVPPNALRQNSQSGPAPFSYCSSPYVLSEVYIPQNITVHLGKPSNTSARNVTVPFIDYIKNVASSEIYPTWPDSALRANIYAQISLALNRVFTEWYPSKGYSYQITNSTQFDQYYVHGRNIFDNISKIVDEIFNVYIRKTGDFQPFYAEYCNGTTATCPGMSQWGTVDLANRGFTPIRILRNYYGNDVNLVESNVIKEIQQSYPGTPLRVGSTGFDVSVIQRQLNRISRNYPLIGNVTVDGNFGTGTENAVKTFQKIFNLTQDGVVGKSTWYKISYIYVAVKKLAELGSEGEPFPPAGPPTQPSQSSLKRGDTGGGVSYLQFMLSYLSTFYTSINDITIDGIFGSGTETAVKQFQSLAKLNVDGIVGKTTWEALVSYYNSLYLDNNPNQVYPGQYYGTVLRQGSTGPQVKEMQFYLQFLSFYYPSIPKIAADGIFGSGTRTAVIAFQNYFGLVADGLVGLQTWTKLFEVFSGIVNGIILPGEKPGVYPGYVLRLGSTGQRVEEVQFYLSVLAKKYPSIPIITPDGKFGVATQNAVIAFQRYFGLAQDGIIGPQTWNKIYTEYFNIRLDPSTLYNFVSISYPG
ncbi:MAG: peptidoglycan-binding protein, partial [Oscillospiraceae bacterium]